MREELRIYVLESFLLDDAGRAFGLETSVDAFQLLLGELGRLAEGFQAVRSVDWLCFEIFEFGICEQGRVNCLVKSKILSAPRARGEL